MVKSIKSVEHIARTYFSPENRAPVVPVRRIDLMDETKEGGFLSVVNYASLLG